MRCCYVFLPPSSNALVALPHYRVRPAIFIQCTHTDQGPTLHQALCRVDAVEAWEEGGTACLHAPAWVCLAPSAWPFFSLTQIQVHSFFSLLIEFLCRLLLEGVFERLLVDPFGQCPALCSPTAHFPFSLWLYYSLGFKIMDLQL